MKQCCTSCQSVAIVLTQLSSTREIRYHNGMSFYTFVKDNDENKQINSVNALAVVRKKKENNFHQEQILSPLLDSCHPPSCWQHYIHVGVEWQNLIKIRDYAREQK